LPQNSEKGERMALIRPSYGGLPFLNLATFYRALNLYRSHNVKN